MDRTVITDAHAPNPIGSYNQAVIANGFVFTAGQIAIDPDTGKLIEGNFKDRVEQVFKNLSAILERCLLYTSPSPRDLSTSRMPSSA